MYFYSHVFSRHPVIFCSFYVPKKCVWCPYHLGRVSCHVKRRAEIMRQPWIIPPLTEENIHRIFLRKEKPKIIWLRKNRQVSVLTCWLFSHHASLFNFSNGNDLELNVDHNRGTYEEDYTKFIRHATANTELMSHLSLRDCQSSLKWLEN